MAEFRDFKEVETNTQAQELGDFFNRLTRGHNYDSHEPFKIEINKESGNKIIESRLSVETSGEVNVRKIKISRFWADWLEGDHFGGVVELVMENNSWRFEGSPSSKIIEY